MIPAIFDRFWKPAVGGFYLLILLEVLWMISPFAVYLYTVYSPFLDTLHRFPATRWLTDFYLPHLAHAKSWFIQALTSRYLFFTFAGAGLVIFFIGAVQLYAARLLHRGVVTRGLYRYVRHPQYVGLAISGLGFLFIWPRLLVLVMYATMVFGYWLLAMHEERVCREKFGDDYRSYQARTAMFLAGRMTEGLLSRLPPGGPRRAGVITAMYFGAIAIPVAVALALRSYSKSTVSTFMSRNLVAISIEPTSPDSLRRIVTQALQDLRVAPRLPVNPDAVSHRGVFLIYVAPRGWRHFELTRRFYPKGSGLERTGRIDQRREIFVLRVPGASSPETILGRAVVAQPLFRLVLDTRDGRVLEIHDPLPTLALWRRAPMPTF